MFCFAFSSPPTNKHPTEHAKANYAYCKLGEVPRRKAPQMPLIREFLSFHLSPFWRFVLAEVHEEGRRSPSVLSPCMTKQAPPPNLTPEKSHLEFCSGVVALCSLIGQLSRALSCYTSGCFIQLSSGPGRKRESFYQV